MLKAKIKFARRARKRGSALNPQPSTLSQVRAFTLLELLVVIAILGILAALTVPVLKNFGKSDATLGASRQLLDGVARARQMAMSQRTTVYMVFVPTNYWIDSSQTFPNPWFNNLSFTLKTAVTNLADRQLSGYNFIARGAMGDQPGQHAWHYLGPWQGLPDGTFIALWKFAYNRTNRVTDNITGRFFDVAGFHVTNTIPFPTETGTNNVLPLTQRILLPYLAFNYMGQLTFDGQTLAERDEYIPLAHGSVLAGANAATRAFVLSGAPPVPNSPDVAELPPGNSTNISYSLVHVDRLTGRAVLEFHKM